MYVFSKEVVYRGKFTTRFTTAITIQKQQEKDNIGNG